MSSKNQLQEYCQRHHIDLPKYSLVSITGQDHNKRFVSQVHISSKSATHKEIKDEQTLTEEFNLRKYEASINADLVSFQYKVERCDPSGNVTSTLLYDSISDEQPLSPKHDEIAQNVFEQFIKNRVAPFCKVPIVKKGALNYSIAKPTPNDTQPQGHQQVYIGEPSTTKVGSEVSAAKVALDSLYNAKQSNVKQFRQRTIVFGDVENLPREFANIEDHPATNVVLHCVTSPNANYQPSSPSTLMTKVASTRRDACDTAIIILSTLSDCTNIVILSKDLFAESLREVLTELIPNKHVTVIRSYQEFLNLP